MPTGDGIFGHPLSWRSRTFRSFAALILLVLIVRLIWGWQTHRALTTRLDDLRRRGQPVDVADLVFPTVQDSKNAWHYETLAVGALVSGIDSPANSNLDYDNFPPYPSEWWKLADASEKAHGKAFAFARQARQFRRVQFYSGLTSPLFATLLPYLNTARELANMLADGAVYAHLKGNDTEALARVRDVLHLGRSLHQDGFHISQLVATGIEALAIERVQIIAPGLDLKTANAVTRQEAQELIAELLDEDLLWHGFEESLHMEQLAAIDTCRWLSDPTWFIRPLAERQASRDIKSTQGAIDASRLRTQPEAQAALAKAPAEPAELQPLQASYTGGPPPVPRFSRAFSSGMGRWSRYVDTKFRAAADRRVAAVSLAAQLYRADHGAWPAQLPDLVPAYLPAIPTDPFRADGRPLGYLIAKLPDGAPRPLVFFDTNTPGEPFINARPMFGWQTRIGVDVVTRGAPRQFRDLSRFTPPPSPKTVDNNP